jgi:molybdopterin/thiamine biosynthesis adenylyltransferase
LARRRADLGLADAGRADHQDVLGQHLVAQVVEQLLAAPAVAQRHGDGALGVVLADDEAVEFGDDLAGDRVALSNLHRQIQFATAEIGDEKTEATAGAMRAINPDVRVLQVFAPLDADNAPSWIADNDLVIDGTDDFATRLLVSDTCVMLNKPLVSAALGRWAGQIGVFTGRPCYRCLVPEVPPDAETCQRVGVVGALAGVVGSMAALEAVKLIIGAGRPLDGRLLIYDGLQAEARTVEVAADPACRGVWGLGESAREEVDVASPQFQIDLVDPAAVAGVSHLDEIDRLARALQGPPHDLALRFGDDLVVLAVDQQDRTLDLRGPAAR